MDDDYWHIRASYLLFGNLKCSSKDIMNDFDDLDDALLTNKELDDTFLEFMDEDKMRCHILRCLAAYRLVQIRKNKKDGPSTNDCDLLKRKVFSGAISMMLNSECDNVLDPFLSSFVDYRKIPDDRSWLPMHFAIAFGVGNEISEEEVHVLHAANPLAMHSFSGIDGANRVKGYTPIHLLCMQKRPNMSLLSNFCLKDPKAFVLCDHNGRSALHMIAQYSESIEVLQIVLQIDHALTAKEVNGPFLDNNIPILTTPLGLLCGRHLFPSFDEMFLCLIGVNNTVKVIYDGVVQCMQQYRDCSDQDISPGSRGARTMILLRKLLDSNSDVTSHDNSNVFHWACSCLSGQLGIAALSLFLSKNSAGIRHISTKYGFLPIHHAAASTSLDFMKFLVQAYPESLSMVTSQRDVQVEEGDYFGGETLLHLALTCATKGNAMVYYLCTTCPALIHMKCNKGETPLHVALIFKNFEAVNILCNTDVTVVRCQYTPSDISDHFFQALPLHFLIDYAPPRLEVSDEGDYFRRFLSLYPASAGIKDGHLISPYDLAVSLNLSAYFLRLLLAADPSIDPVKRRDMNFAARRDGIFLAFRALSTNRTPIIWARIRHEGKDLLARVISYL